jgi:hypothetical protein
MRNVLNLLMIPILASAAVAGPRTDWKETISPEEASFIQALPAEFNKMQSNVASEAGTKKERGLHNKGHLAIKAEVTVLDNLPPEYKQGAFAKPTTYQSWVRFSNGQGSRGEDRSPDIRGLAVKMLDVAGEPLTDEKSFDILCMQFPAQPTRDIFQFMAFIRAQKNPLTLGFKLARDVGFGESVRILKWAANNLGRRINSLATEEFNTTLPLQYGPYACKIAFRPQNGSAPTSANTGDADFLKADLRSRVTKGDLKWDVMVQLYTDPTRTPIEDASVVWDAPFVKVAELKIAKRDGATIEKDEKTGEPLLWHPWHAPKEHKPLGSLMRARKVVYPASGKVRGATKP